MKHWVWLLVLQSTKENLGWLKFYLLFNQLQMVNLHVISKFIKWALRRNNGSHCFALQVLLYRCIESTLPGRKVLCPAKHLNRSATYLHPATNGSSVTSMKHLFCAEHYVFEDFFLFAKRFKTWACQFTPAVVRPLRVLLDKSILTSQSTNRGYQT